MVPKFEDDYFRYTGKKWDTITGMKNVLTCQNIRFTYFLRQKEFARNKVKRTLFRVLLYRMGRKYGLEIAHGANVSGGFYMNHAFNITINPNTIIGKNFNIHKGATIGLDNKGKRKGTPVIGENVWVGFNSTIVGNISIGNNVLIAPNTFVNFDVPDNSIVIGSQAKIIPKADATEGFISKTV